MPWLFTKRRTGKGLPNRNHFRLAFEALEDRLAPAIITLVGADRFFDGPVASLVYTGNNHYAAVNLRSAIVGADDMGGPDTIVLETGTYSMNSGLGAFLVSDPSGTLTIMNGAGGMSTINALGQSRVFLNQSGLFLSGLKIENGVGIDQGGAIFNNGTLSITNCQFVNNEAVGGGDGAPVQGGAIFSNGNRILNVQNTSFTNNIALGGATNFLLGGNASAAGGAIFIGAGAGAYADNIIADTFTGNQAIGGNGTLYLGIGAMGGVGAGGGVFAEAGNYDLNIIDATFAGNVAQGGIGILADGGNAAGGGLYLQNGGLGNTRLANDTIAQNSAVGGAGQGFLASRGVGSGGGLADNFAGIPVAKLINTIVAKNAANVNNDVDGVFASLGTNLIGDVGSTTSFSSARGDYTGTTKKPLDPGLDPLGNYGGPTQTFRPSVGSFVVDRGNNIVVTQGVTTDQRGQPRRSGIAVDIGAYEAVLPNQNKTYTLSQGTTLTTTGINGLLSGYHNPLHKTVTVQLVPGTGPSTGTLKLNGNGTFTYTPPKSFHGTVSFQFLVLANGQPLDVFTAVFNVTKTTGRLTI